jgi:hypothetical protein
MFSDEGTEARIEWPDLFFSVTGRLNSQGKCKKGSETCWRLIWRGFWRHPNQGSGGGQDNLAARRGNFWAARRVGAGAGATPSTGPFSGLIALPLRSVTRVTPAPFSLANHIVSRIVDRVADHIAALFPRGHSLFAAACSHGEA